MSWWRWLWPVRPDESEALEALDRVRRRDGEVARLGTRLREEAARNHFSESVVAALHRRDAHG